MRGPGAGIVLDGPFAETKEQLLGFHLVDYDTDEEAIAAARKLREVNPSAVYEIRPVKLYVPADGFGATPPSDEARRLRAGRRADHRSAGSGARRKQ